MNNSRRNFEVVCGLVLSVFAAVLAVADLYSGKYGDDEMAAINEKASAFMWYQSKSIKATTIEGNFELLGSLLRTGSIDSNNFKSIQSHTESLKKDIHRYQREMKEILLGSEKVGETEWSQEVNGEKGKVIGALEWQENAAKLSQVGDRLDLAKLLLQLCLVIGAVSLVIQTKRPQQVFFTFTCVLGLAGSVMTAFTLTASWW